MRSILLCFALFDFRLPSLSLSLPLFAYANRCNYYNSVEHFYGREIKNTCGNICVLIARENEKEGEGGGGSAAEGADGRDLCAQLVLIKGSARH